MANYIFSTGTARGGTGLLAHMVSVHARAKIVSDPFLGLFKSFRNAIIKESANYLPGDFDLQSPFGDGYFTLNRRKFLDLIFSSNINLNFDQSEWRGLKPVLKKRAVLASADIIPFIDEIHGGTYREIFDSCFSMLGKIRSPDRELNWIGIHENWTIDFFIPLAKGFENSKFIVVIRDPRAVFASNSREKDPSVIGHILSYAKCHRKLMACAAYYKNMELFKDRLHIVKYEDMLINPEAVCKSICAFLEIEFDKGMLDTTKYINHATGGVHDGLSNYEENAQGFVPARIDRWRKYLSQERADLIDFVCGPEMLLYNYQTVNIDPFDLASTNCMRTIIDEMVGYKAWRTDFMDPLQDYGYELFRRQLLAIDQKTMATEINLIERNFLFYEVYRQIKSMQISSNYVN